MTSIEKILSTNGPMLSGDLLRILEMENPDSTPAAIRKRLSRIGEPIKKLFGFFADRQVFYYLEEHIQSSVYYHYLGEAIAKAAKRVDAYIAAIEFHRGFINSQQMAAYGFCPIENLTGHKKFQSYLDILIQFNFLRRYNDDHYTLVNDLNSHGGFDFKKFKAEETAKSFVLSQFLSWARSIGLISYNTGSFFSNFGKFQWCFTSPGYVNGIREFKDNKVMPYFVVADVLIGKEATERNVLFFIEKVKVLNAQKNLSRFIPFLIIDSATEQAFQMLKDNGIVVGLVNQLFGKEYSELLASLVNTMVNAGAILKKNPEAYIELLKKIDRLVEGKTNNLRGDLFELAVGFYHKESQSLDVGKELRLQDGLCEVDVFAVYRDEIIIAECKGYKKMVNVEEVDRWLKKIAKVRDWMLDIEPYANKRMRAEFWSTGDFHPDALAKLQDATKRTKKYDIVYYGSFDILNQFRNIKAKRIVDTLKQYFFSDEI